MRIENDFEVRAPLQRVWEHVLDVERIAPCAPGAELTEVVDERIWKGRLNVRLGPIGMSFAGTVVVQERDEASHKLVLKADGREQRGKGAATALVTATLQGVEGGTRVVIDTDLTISGAAAQYGRGMIGDVSQRLTTEFAQCLQEQIGAAEMSDPDPPAARVAEHEQTLHSEPLAGPGQSDAVAAQSVPEGSAAAPLKGLRLAAWALWRAAVRFFRRLVRGGGR